MTIVCETVEDLTTATSECPATDIIVVAVSAGVSTASVVHGITQPLLIGTAAATSTLSDSAYALVTNTAAVTNTVVANTVVTKVLVAPANARGVLFAAFNQLGTSTAAATSTVAFENVPTLLTSTADATSTTTVHASVVVQATAEGAASSLALSVADASATSEAAATSTVTLARTASATVTDAAAATAEVVTSTTPQAYLLTSSGAATSVIVMQVAHAALLDNTADATSDVWYKDPSRIAWLMNTETTAASWYSNFDFESITQTGDKVLAVGPDGLYELTGDTDSGEQIDAAVVSGFTDFGEAQTKRVENMFFGYTSDGIISLTAETYESAHAPTTYLLEQRAANAPRNSRVTPGKGLYGRYWRMGIRNVAGSNFEIHDASVDIAVSSRRV